MTTNQWKASGKSFDYKGHPIFYITDGQGPALLMLHGFPTSSWDWSKIWPDLTQSYRVVAPDFIGFGYSAKPTNYHYSLVDQANLTEELVKHLSIDECFLVAHDYAVSVAQELLTRQNEGALTFRINKTLLLNGGLFPGVHRPRLIQKLLMTPIGPFLGKLYRKKNLEKTFGEIFGAATPPSSTEIDGFWELINYNNGKTVVHKLIRYMAERVTHQERWLHALQRSVCPIKLLNGAADPVSGYHLVEHYREVIDDPDCEVLEGIGHYPQVEAPDQVLRTIKSYLKS